MMQKKGRVVVQTEDLYECSDEFMGMDFTAETSVDRSPWG